MGGYVQAKAGPARLAPESAAEPKRMAEATSGAAASASAGNNLLNQSPAAQSLRQLRKSLDAAPAVRSQLALQRALDRSAVEPGAPQKRARKPSLQPKRVAINDDAGRLASQAGGSGKVLQKMDSDQPSGRTLRASTRAQGFDPTDPHGRTRGAERKEAMVQAGTTVRRNLARQPFASAADGTALWDGSSRPGWGGRDQDFIESQASQESADHKRTEYLCVTARGITSYLPKKADREGREQYVTVGHIVQWRNYCVSNCDPHDYEVEGGTISAYSMDEISASYADTSNLQLEGNVYNSTSSARPYTGDPSNQVWK